MNIEDMDPTWTSDDLIDKIVSDANEEDLILYLSGLDDDGLRRVEDRNKVYEFSKKCSETLKQLENLDGWTP